MTVAALVRGAKDYNALVVDTGAFWPPDEVVRFDKLRRAFGETYVTCIGDSSILALLLSRTWDSTKQRPNLRDADFMSDLFSELVTAHRTGKVLGVPTAFQAPQPCTMLAVCNRSEVFFWRATYDPTRCAYELPNAATFLEPNTMTVLRGMTVVPMEGFSTVDLESAEAFMVDQMIHANREVERTGADKLPYPLDRCVSGIILPHRTSDAAIRIDPGVPPMSYGGLPPEPAWAASQP